MYRIKRINPLDWRNLRKNKLTRDRLEAELLLGALLRPA